ncbi:FecR family protein [Mucilaginibacter sp. RCC_168]|uniref:FecR family protein n=1 Tax=Mucilaginibacter sp. RCC_168 TaxID=3239221 RepID=UPI0035244A6A
MNRQTIYNLIQKHQEGRATASEKQALTNWYNKVSSEASEFPEDEDSVHEEILTRLLSEIDFPKSRSFRYKNWAVAASILMILSVGAFFFAGKRRQITNSTITLNQQIKPGSNKAFLVLANGKKIFLADVKNGKIAQQEGSQVIKTSDGQLVYNDNPATPTDGSSQYNTIETPKGGQYQLLLPDGTRVWLNAASSLKYPVSFTSAKERKVELSGEAYFEVAHNKNIPFRVVTDKQLVEVLGTHFNVNAYHDELDTKTTLLEGAIKITAGDKNTTLKPGQEADLTGTLKVSEVDPRDAIDWKNGFFRFDDDLEIVMRQIARWYDVKIIYDDESVKKEPLVGVTARFSDISILLKKIEQITDVKFIIEGSTIIVTKNKQTKL